MYCTRSHTHTGVRYGGGCGETTESERTGTLEPQTDVVYQIEPRYQPGHELGVRWDDPAFAIAWPAAPKVISPRDGAYPDYQA